MHFREANEEDIPALISLYKLVAQTEDGIARNAQEITISYIDYVLERSKKSGLMIVCVHPEDPGQLIGEVHGYKQGLSVFEHVMSELTLVIHPDFQGRKIGKTILAIFLEEIVKNRADIGRVELIVRESNRRAIALYQSLGFRIEGRLEMRIKTSTRSYEADIPMGWQNPNYEF
jgi:ribosomal protein S18 acetylase RimI-like enzyme